MYSYPDLSQSLKSPFFVCVFSQKYGIFLIVNLINFSLGITELWPVASIFSIWID